MLSLMILGDHYERDDFDAGVPFVSKRGKFLRANLHEIGITPNLCHLNYVFPTLPAPTATMKNLCATKKQGVPIAAHLPPIPKAGYLRTENLHYLEELKETIASVKPNIIVGLGNVPLWALFPGTKPTQVRGTVMVTEQGQKFISTHDMSAIYGNYKLLPIFKADMLKALRESYYPEFKRPARELWLEPTLKDCHEFYHKYILNSKQLSVDIETVGKEITCIGFAPTEDRALVIPFHDSSKADNNYWPSRAMELKAWEFVRHVCSLPQAAVCGQNFIYDMKFLWDNYGIPVRNAAEDTMLLHHALQPEMKKGLGFLASIYTDEPSWKFMRKVETAKKEDL